MGLVLFQIHLSQNYISLLTLFHILWNPSISYSYEKLYQWNFLLRIMNIISFLNSFTMHTSLRFEKNRVVLWITLTVLLYRKMICNLQFSMDFIQNWFHVINYASRKCHMNYKLNIWYENFFHIFIESKWWYSAMTEGLKAQDECYQSLRNHFRIEQQYLKFFPSNLSFTVYFHLSNLILV